MNITLSLSCAALRLLFLASSLGKTVLRYDPPEDVLARIGRIVGDILGKMDIREALDVKFPNRATKFRVGLPDDKNFGVTI